MPTRLVVRGRTAWRSGDLRLVDWSRGVPTRGRGEDKEVVDCASAISADAPDSPARGTHWRDRETGVAYQVLAHCAPEQGWASSEFWERRWRVDAKAILRFVERGLMDAAVEEGSDVRRYRCRSERAVLEHADMRQARKRASIAQKNDKRIKTGRR